MKKIFSMFTTIIFFAVLSQIPYFAFADSNHPPKASSTIKNPAPIKIQLDPSIDSTHLQKGQQYLTPDHHSLVVIVPQKIYRKYAVVNRTVAGVFPAHIATDTPLSSNNAALVLYDWNNGVDPYKPITLYARDIVHTPPDSLPFKLNPTQRTILNETQSETRYLTK